MATDPFIATARYIVDESLKEISKSIEGLPPEALNWRPAGDETNSIAVLATHVMHSTRSWLSITVGAPLPERDRPSEFRASAADTGELLAFIDQMSSDCLDLLKPREEIDWAAIRKTHARPGQAPEHVPAAFALMHAVEHLREHMAHLSLTRQLWDQRPA